MSNQLEGLVVKMGQDVDLPPQVNQIKLLLSADDYVAEGAQSRNAKRSVGLRWHFVGLAEA